MTDTLTIVRRYDPEEYQRNKEKYIERQKRYRNNPKRREAYLERAKIRSKKWQLANKDRRRAYNKVWWQKQISKLEALIGRKRPKNCEICNAETKIVFDHCHKTGKPRGWLCDRCNTTLGKCEDNPKLLRGLALYLDQNTVE